jgi:hypothetical protein
MFPVMQNFDCGSLKAFPRNQFSQRYRRRCSRAFFRVVLHPAFSGQGKHKPAMTQECRNYETFGVQLAFTTWLEKSLQALTGGRGSPGYGRIF